MIKLTEEHYQIAALGDGSTFRSYEGENRCPLPGDRQVTFSSDGNIYYEEYNSQIHPKWGVHMIDEIKVVNGINHETIKDAFNWVYRL